MLSIGFIGTVRMAGVHLEKLARIENVKVTSTFDINRESVEDFTKKMSAKPYYEDIDNYFSKEKPDAVWILTPPDAHIAAIKKAVEYDVPFFVEKPLARFDDDLEDFAPQVERVFHSIGYMMRYQKIIDLAKSMVENEDIALAMAQWFFQIPMVKSNLRKEKSGGQVLEQMTHLIDLLRYLVGDIVDVYCRSTRGMFPEIPDFSCDDASASVLTFKKGTVGNLLCTYALTRDIWSKHKPKIQLILKKALIEIVPGHYLKRTMKGEELIEENNDSHHDADKAFIDGLLSDDRSKIKSTFTDALKTLKVSLAANRSMQNEKKEIV